MVFSPPKPVRPVPPRVAAKVPVHPTVILAARNSDVAGVPPRVKVTLVSSVSVKAAPVMSEPARVALMKLEPSPRRTLPVVAAPATLKPVATFKVPVNEAALEMVWPFTVPLIVALFPTFKVRTDDEAAVVVAKVEVPSTERRLESVAAPVTPRVLESVVAPVIATVPVAVRLPPM